MDFKLKSCASCRPFSFRPLFSRRFCWFTHRLFSIRIKDLLTFAGKRDFQSRCFALKVFVSSAIHSLSCPKEFPFASLMESTKYQMQKLSSHSVPPDSVIGGAYLKYTVPAKKQQHCRPKAAAEATRPDAKACEISVSEFKLCRSSKLRQWREYFA